jgi:hypothetical protein
MASIDLFYDPNWPHADVVWECTKCGSQFDSGGRPIHRSGCSQTGEFSGGMLYSYGEGYRLIFGPSTVSAVKQWAGREGESKVMPHVPISLKILKQRFPELL